MPRHSDFKKFPASCSRYNSEEKSPKSPIPETKLSRINASFPVQFLLTKCLKDFEKITGFGNSFCPFISKSLHIHFNPSQNGSPLLLVNGLGFSP